MGASIYNWIVVFDDGTTRCVHGETPTDAIEEIDWSGQQIIVAVVRNSFW